MKTITFTCETITPMFLSGADGQTPELRPPSIKGALRFWWRAMNGELAPDNNYLNLKNTEQNIFGGTGGFKWNNKKIEAERSHFNIRISNVSESIYHAKNDFDGDGLKYFFYLIVPDNKGTSMKENDEALKNTSFDIIISADEEDALLDACASFWLLTYFGGLGSRARRGGGSFYIKNVFDEENILQDKLQMMPTDNIKDFLTKSLKDAAKIIQKGTKTTISNKYSTLQSKHIYISTQGKPNWKGALNEIGALMKNFRTDTQKDPEQRKYTQTTLNKKAAFGLPISVRNEQPQVVEFDKKDDFNHRSSPLYISVVKLRDRYYWTLVYLQGEFMPPNTKIIFKPKTKGLPPQDWLKENDSLLKEFIKEKISPNSIQITF
ncbi:MAG: type III-B CRISPR module RAMP protein Cmr1 [Microscillaceae bacterium]|nr:type III-B CRISPR module RAMP protein Cmr1 [Microscillaceae bacterium]